ncbi:uncharacterized protein I206_104566 [Kwoniella pini CBS 10737]|uniref:Uncharacterized protein n=1 Tax=Kwoniella pini CBS 10737 TaxID=1296096 RepID=A0A1B9I7E5_9TREE|nr:uncharacterized protein I206_02100 [Kwoniella pini CBS 10737]OCF51386.1 hypothetical protein I206_02100 [Kwoniella pini CBS 10737]
MYMLSLFILLCQVFIPFTEAKLLQKPLTSKFQALIGKHEAVIDHPLFPPRINYAKLDDFNEDEDDTADFADLMDGMKTKIIYHSGGKDEKVNLMFFSDGYTIGEFDKFVKDVEYLKEDIISLNGSMGHVVDLLNIWATFIPSNQSGIGTHGQPLVGNTLGLYRPGSELRAVYVKHPKVARKACEWFREGHAGQAGCDQAILLGNDPLYGGLGGEFTIITSSKSNGPQVLRHELGHSLIPVGEEYDGGWVYSGVNADKTKNVDNLKWKRYLSNPDNTRIEDAKMAIQAYPWHDLDEAGYKITFESANNPQNTTHTYPTALLRTSLSSIPHPSHIDFRLNNQSLNLAKYFPKSLAGSLDRRWLDISLPNGLKCGENSIKVQLTDIGKKAKAGQGGKMITSVEIIEYGGEGRFNHTLGNIGAYPTFSLKGHMTLRPTNEECLMRNVTHPRFCQVCADGLRHSLEKKIKKKKIKD